MIFRFGVFEVDSTGEELWRKGMRVRIHAQPFRILLMLLDRPGAVVSREDISRQLWPDGTFVDYEQGVNSAINRLRDALGDKAANPMFIETVARKGYRFIAPVDVFDKKPSLPPPVLPSVHGEPGLTDAETGTDPGCPTHDGPIVMRGTSRESATAPAQTFPHNLLATPADLPETPHATVRTLFLLLQTMYLAFYIGALANLPEIADLLAPIPIPVAAITVLAALLIPVRIFLICAVLFRAPGFRARYLMLWPALLAADAVWALAPLLLLHHISEGVALACMAVLVYAPFAQRSLMLMGAVPDLPHKP